MIATLLFLLLQAPAGAPSAQDAERADVQLRAAAREAELASQPVARPANAHDVLNGILADPAFKRARVDSWQSALQRRMREWFTDLWDRTIGAAIGRRRAAELLAWTAAAAAIVVLVVWLIRLTSRQRAERPVSMGTIGIPRLPGHVLGAQAAELIRAGRIREGARIAYQAGLSRMIEEGAMRANDTQTPRESLRQLPRGHRRRQTFAALTALFERAWYGSRPPDADTGDTILTLLEDLQCLSFDRAR
jgi:Domain of unknown function (DUF4129)